MRIMKKFIITGIVALLLVGCITTPKTEYTQQLAMEKTMEFFKEDTKSDFLIHWVATNSQQSAIAELTESLRKANKYKAILTVSGRSSATVLSLVLQALDNVDGTLPNLRLVFVGNAIDTSSLKEAVQAKQATFFELH